MFYFIPVSINITTTISKLHIMIRKIFKLNLEFWNIKMSFISNAEVNMIGLK